MSERRKPNAIRVWGGFIGGQLQFTNVDTGFGGFGHNTNTIVPALFKTRRDAREQFQDVRPIWLKETPA